MCNFFKTVSIFKKNPYINFKAALARHLLWQFRKIINGFPCDIRLENFKVRIKNRSIANGAGGLLNAAGYYDPNNMRLIEELFLKQLSRTFFDVGAYIGVYSLIAAYGSEAAVHSFEPHPFTFGALSENISLNGFGNRIKAFQLALSNMNGDSSFSDGAGVPTNKLESSGAKLIKVKTIRGDTFCRERNIIPDVIKVDVEGEEEKVLFGFEDCLDDIKIVIVESRRLDRIRKILCGRHRFLGPYSLDYRKRLFRDNFNHSCEDWIFIHSDFKSVLEGSNFSFFK